MRGTPVLLDTCVLYPFYLADTLLSLADTELYQLLWTEQILEELRTNLSKSAGITEHAAEQRLTSMKASFPFSCVQDFEHLIPQMENHPKDRHVLAAAVMGEAKSIVTANIKDFPKDACDPYRIEILRPDDFLLELLSSAPSQVTSGLQRQVSRYKRSPKTVNGLSECLTQTAPAFAAQIFDGHLE